MECVAIRLQPPQRIRLVCGALDDMARRSTKILHNALELVARRWLLGDIELELGPLRLVLCLMRAGLVFGRMCYSLRIGLLEEGEDACGCLVAGLVEEGYDVLRAVLSSSQYANCYYVDSNDTYLAKESFEHDV